MMEHKLLGKQMLFWWMISFILLLGALFYVLPIDLAIWVGFLPIVFVLIFTAPAILCAALICFSYFRYHEVISVLYPLQLPQVFMLTGLVSLGVKILKQRSTLYWKPELTLFVVLMCLATVSVAFAVNRPLALKYWQANIGAIVFIVFLLAWLVRSAKDFQLIMRAIVVSGLGIAGVAIYNKIQGIDLMGGRVTIKGLYDSTLGDPNDLALTLLLPASFALALILTKGTGLLNRLLGYITFPLIVLVIIATQSRGGLLGLVAVMATFGYKKFRHKSLVTIILAVAVVGFYAVANIADRFGGSLENGLDESAMSRIHIWKTGIKMVIDRPVFGVGLHNFIDSYYFYTDYWDGRNHDAHSIWIKVLAELGIIGFVVYVLLVIMMYKNILRMLQQIKPCHFVNQDIYCTVNLFAHGLFAAFIGFIVSGTFLSHAFTLPLYLLLAFSVALQKFLQSSNRDVTTSAF